MRKNYRLPLLYPRIKTLSRRAIPKKGGCLLLSPRRSFLDPEIVARSTRRRIEFPETPEEADRLLNSGKAVCIFPEGEMNWYGNGKIDSNWFRYIAGTSAPVIIMNIRGSYDMYPPFANRPGLRGHVHVRFTVSSAPAAKAAFLESLEQECLDDIVLRRKHIPVDARNIEEIIYICPACGELLTIRGEKSGRLECRVCGESWTFIRGKALSDNSNRNIVPLRYVEDFARDSLKKHRIKQIQFQIAVKTSPDLKREDPGLLILSADHFILALNGKNKAAFVFSYNDVESIRIEGRDRLDIQCLQDSGNLRFLIRPPIHACLFLTHAIRIRAFGDGSAETHRTGEQE